MGQCETATIFIFIKLILSKYKVWWLLPYSKLCCYYCQTNFSSCVHSPKEANARWPFEPTPLSLWQTLGGIYFCGIVVCVIQIFTKMFTYNLNHRLHKYSWNCIFLLYTFLQTYLLFSKRKIFLYNGSLKYSQFLKFYSYFRNLTNQYLSNKRYAS